MQMQTQMQTTKTTTKPTSEALVETVELVQLPIAVPPTFREVMKSSRGSAAGYSAVSTWLTCPEKARLQAAGVRRKDAELPNENTGMPDLAFGTLVHHLRSLRFLYGHEAVEHALKLWREELPYAAWVKARLLFRTYESMYPRAQDTMEILGVEVEVVTDVSRSIPTNGRSPLYRTVRYDTVIRVPGVGGAPPELFSFEAKTTSRSGEGSIRPYMPQAMTQVALWNANPHLVEKYGLMRGVIFDCFVKTATPNVDRLGPYYFGRAHSKLALEYLGYAETGGVTFGVQPYGNYPRMLHACWGRWKPCEYISLCHEQAFGDYDFGDGGETE